MTGKIPVTCTEENKQRVEKMKMKDLHFDVSENAQRCTQVQASLCIHHPGVDSMKNLLTFEHVSWAQNIHKGRSINYAELTCCDML